MAYTIPFNFTPAWDATGTTFTTQTATSTGTLNVGDVIYVYVPYRVSGDTTQVITDTYSNTWTEITAAHFYNSADAFAAGRHFYSVITTGGANPSVTATAGAASSLFGCFPVVMRGMTATPLHVVATPKRQANVTAATDALISNSFSVSTPPVAIIEIANAMSAANGMRINVGTSYTALLTGQKSNSLADYIKIGHRRGTAVETTNATFSPTQSGTDFEVMAVTFLDASTDPIVWSVDTTSPHHLGSLTITGNHFGSSQGASTITIGGQSQSVSSWGNTTIVIPSVDRGSNKYGVNVSLVITVGAITANYTLTLSAQSGWSYTNLATPFSTSIFRITAISDLASGDQLTYDNDSGNNIVYTDATFSSIGDPFEVECYSGGAWGAEGLQSFTGIINDRDVLLQAASPRNLSQDNLLTPDQKSAWVQEYNAIIGEQTSIDSQADACSVSRTSYDGTIVTLTSYLTTIPGWNVIPGVNVEIVGSTFRQKFTDVHAARAVLLYNISQNVGTTQIVPAAATDVITTTASGVAVTYFSATETTVATISYTALVTGPASLTVTAQLTNNGHTIGGGGGPYVVNSGIRILNATNSTASQTLTIPNVSLVSTGTTSVGSFNLTTIFSLTQGTTYSFQLRVFNQCNGSDTTIGTAEMRLEAIKR